MPAGLNSDILLLSFSTSTAAERIWQFIKTGVILFAIGLQYIFFPKPTLIFPAFKTFIGFAGIEALRMIPERATWENQSLTDLQFHTEALIFFYCLISHSDPCQMPGSAYVYRYSVCVQRLRGRIAERSRATERLEVYFKSYVFPSVCMALYDTQASAIITIVTITVRGVKHLDNAQVDA